MASPKNDEYDGGGFGDEEEQVSGAAGGGSTSSVGLNAMASARHPATVRSVTLGRSDNNVNVGQSEADEDEGLPRSSGDGDVKEESVNTRHMRELTRVYTETMADMKRQWSKSDAMRRRSRE